MKKAKIMQEKFIVQYVENEEISGIYLTNENNMLQY